MRFMILSCDVFTREVCHCVARTPHIVDLDFTDKGAHDDPDYLRTVLQEKIDACDRSGKGYEAILLCYGLCGNAVVGLCARRVPLVVPRAHDCCTLFLGARDRFNTHFGDKPSTKFSAAGYIERGGTTVREASTVRDRMGLSTNYESYVQQYGEENAQYIWEILHAAEKRMHEDDRVVFIDVPETRFLGYDVKCRQTAEKENKEFVRLDGEIRLIEKLVFGDWPTDEFLIVEPGQRIAGMYDSDVVMRADQVKPEEST